MQETDIYEKEGNRLIPKKMIQTGDGMAWELNQYRSLQWPNGNPCKLIYKSMFGSTHLIIRLNEIGGLICTRYA